MNAPERIYLQVEGEEWDALPKEVESPDVTWCSDRIHKSDPEYIRADIHEREMEDIHRKEIVVQRLVTAIADAESAKLRTELSALKEQRETARGEELATLEHIAEYWNGLENPRALSDALTHMVETAQARITFLSSSRKQKEKP